VGAEQKSALARRGLHGNLSAISVFWSEAGVAKPEKHVYAVECRVKDASSTLAASTIYLLAAYTKLCDN